MACPDTAKVKVPEDVVLAHCKPIHTYISTTHTLFGVEKNEARRPCGYVKKVLTMHMWCSIDLFVTDVVNGQPPFVHVR